MKRSWGTLIVLLLLPAMIGLFSLALFSREGQVAESVPAAVVNDDVIATLPDGTILPVGRLLVAELIQPEDGEATPYRWEIVPDDVATAGLADGTYYAVARIPEDFSQTVADLLGGTPGTARVSLEASNPADPQMAELSDYFTQATANVVNRFLTRSYLEGSLNGMGQLSDGLGQIQDGANQLAAGLGAAGGGAQLLAGGTNQLADGLFQLSGGAVQLAGGADQAASGAGALAGGLNQLADGMGLAAGGVNQLADGSAQLADGAAQLADGVGLATSNLPALQDGAHQLADGMTQLADGINQLNDQLVIPEMPDLSGIDLSGMQEGLESALGNAQGVVDLLQTTVGALQGVLTAAPNAESLAQSINDGLQAVAVSGAQQATAGVQQMCATATTDEALAICDALAASVDPANVTVPQVTQDQMTQLLTTVQTMQAQLEAISPGAGEQINQNIAALATWLETVGGDLGDVNTLMAMIGSLGDLMDGLPQLADGVQQLADGSTQLADGAQQLAGGVDQLADGMGQLSGGANQLSDGVAQLSDGMSEYAAGAGQLADGAQQSADGAGQLAGGIGQLADGAGQLADGTVLSANGAEQLYDGAQQLADGFVPMTDGATQIGDGLGQVVDEIPVYTPDEVLAMARSLVEPIAVDGVVASDANTVTNIAPTLTTIALWIGAVATFLVLDPIGRSRRKFAAMAPGALAGKGFLPGLGYVAVEGALLAAVWAFSGAGAARPMVAAVEALAAVVAFAAVAHGVIALMGARAGGAALMVLTAVQFAVAPMMIPAVAESGLARAAAEALPVPIAAMGLNSSLIGGVAHGGVSTVLGLMLWAVIGLLIAVAGASRQQQVKAKDLVEAA